MPKFAVYYIPEATTPFYNLGSAILGYDIRAKKNVELSPELGLQIDPHWVVEAQPYGFHLTIGDAIDFNLGDIYRIESEIVSVLNCFATYNQFRLSQNHTEFIPDWGSPIVLRYDPNDHLRFLHTLIVSRVNTLGIGSGYLKSYLKKPEQFEPHQAQRIVNFYSPFILSDFRPHFSLLNPYTGNNRVKLVTNLAKIFKDHKEFEVNTLCLTLQLSEGENWTIYREFKCS